MGAFPGVLDACESDSGICTGIKGQTDSVLDACDSDSDICTGIIKGQTDSDEVHATPHVLLTLETSCGKRACVADEEDMCTAKKQRKDV